VTKKTVRATSSGAALNVTKKAVRAKSSGTLLSHAPPLARIASSIRFFDDKDSESDIEWGGTQRGLK
jgi:hypothetical protein